MSLLSSKSTIRNSQSEYSNMSVQEVGENNIIVITIKHLDMAFISYKVKQFKKAELLFSDVILLLIKIK
jgi:hypothetical protein